MTAICFLLCAYQGLKPENSQKSLSKRIVAAIKHLCFFSPIILFKMGRLPIYSSISLIIFNPLISAATSFISFDQNYSDALTFHAHCDV